MSLSYNSCLIRMCEQLFYPNVTYESVNILNIEIMKEKCICSPAYPICLMVMYYETGWEKFIIV